MRAPIKDLNSHFDQGLTAMKRCTKMSFLSIMFTRENRGFQSCMDIIKLNEMICNWDN